MFFIPCDAMKGETAASLLAACRDMAVVEEDGKLALAVPGQDRVHFLVDHPGTPGLGPRIRASALGKTVLIDGTVPESARRAASIDTIQARSFVIPSGP